MNSKTSKGFSERKKIAEEANVIITESVTALVGRMRDLTPDEHAPEMKALLGEVLMLADSHGQNAAILAAIAETDRQFGTTVASEAMAETIEEPNERTGSGRYLKGT